MVALDSRLRGNDDSRFFPLSHLWEKVGERLMQRGAAGLRPGTGMRSRHNFSFVIPRRRESSGPWVSPEGR
jgi:hypothetical protein